MFRGAGKVSYSNAAYEPGRCVTGHDARGRPVAPFVWRGMEPAGVWRSTAADMLRYLKAQCGSAGKTWRNRALFCIQPQAPVNRTTRIGLGWLLTDSKKNGTLVWHNGGTFGQHAMIAWTPDRPGAMVLLTNRMPPLWHHFVRARRLEALPELLV